MSKYVLYNDLDTHVLLRRILLNNMRDFKIPIYRMYGKELRLTLTKKDLDIEEIKYVRIKIPKSCLNNIPIEEIEEYGMKIDYCDKNKSNTINESLILELEFENFKSLMIEYNNMKHDAPNYYKIESILFSTLEYDSLELLDKDKRNICYVIQMY